MKQKLRGGSAGNCFSKPIFLIPQIFFQSFRKKIFIIILRDIIGLEIFLFSQSQSGLIIYVLFELVLHLKCIVLSQSDSSNSFMYIISNLRKSSLSCFPAKLHISKKSSYVTLKLKSCEKSF